MPRAAGLAAELEKQTGLAVKLIAGSGGVFDVRMNGQLLYSKHQSGRFPELEEIRDLVAARDPGESGIG